MKSAPSPEPGSSGIVQDQGHAVASVAASPPHPSAGPPSAIAAVAVPIPVDGPFDYAVPDALSPLVRRGVRVVVPFGRRTLTGYVLAVRETAAEGSPGSLRPLLDVLDGGPWLTPPVLDLAMWVASYYHAPIGEVCRAALPGGINVEGEPTVAPLVAATEVPSDLPPRLSAILGRLVEAGRDVEVRRLLAAGENRADLLELEERGLVRLGWRLPPPRVSPRVENWVSLAVPPPAGEVPRLGSLQQSVLACIREAGEVPVAELRRRLGRSVAPAVRSLASRGILQVTPRPAPSDPFAGVKVERDRPPVPTPDQRRALDVILPAVRQRLFGAFLLQGVTGSGKTEVYLAAIEEALRGGRQALVLVPEIALTPHLGHRFRARFGDDVAVMHSGLTPSERLDQWLRVRRGEVRIVLGARSAVFAPLPDVGVIVVDEEHDGSFKQEETPRYHARDVALVRGKAAGATVILGSATPSLESYHNSRTAKLRRIVMATRATGAPLPEVEVVDLRGTPCGTGENAPPFTPILQRALLDTVEAGRQAILFLNRRGSSPVVLCRACGKTVSCPRCSVGLTHHRASGVLRCHYCEHAVPFSVCCDACGADAVGLMGLGVQKVEEAVRSLIPGVRVARLDRDALGGRSPRDLLDAMRDRRLDVLVGTQMVAKGHDFPGVTLVGVVLADLGLGIPDFRAGERTFQLLTQVAGRAGRAGEPGRVIIQTFNPDHYVIRCACLQDYEGFAARELEVRRAQRFPPFGYLVGLWVEDPDPDRARRAAEDLARAATDALLRPGAPPASVLGPAPAPIARLRGRYRWQVLLRADRRDTLRWLVENLRFSTTGKTWKRAARVVLDVDPLSML